MEHTLQAKKRNENILEKVLHKALKEGKLRSTSLMENVTSVTNRDIGSKIAVG